MITKKCLVVIFPQKIIGKYLKNYKVTLKGNV